MAWKDKNDPKRLAYRNLWVKRAMRRLKIEVIVAYGGKCECCGEMNMGFLTLDHVYDDGARERQGPRGSTNAVRRRLRREGYPKGRYRVLCYNCNMGRTYNGGVCPHASRSRHGAQARTSRLAIGSYPVAKDND